MIVIGTDGGLLTEPVAYPFVTLAAGQRLDVWVDFTANEVDDTVDLVSEAFTPDNMADGLLQRLIEGRMIEPVTRRPELNENDATLDDLRRGGERLRVMRFQVTDKVEVNEPLPERLAPDDGLPGPDDMADPALPRIFHLRMRVMRGFTIEGGQINDPRLDAREIEEELQVNGANLDDKEVFEQGTVDMLEFHNETPFPHPIHLHGQQFAVTLRQGSDRNHDLWRGLVDVGRHDTVLVLPGENVRIVLAFEDYPGVSMYHCQNLEHFDGGMARYYQVKAPSKDQGSNGKA